MDQVTIGLDLGTSGLRALALDGDGRVRARARRSYPTAHPEPDAAEQSVQHWWDAAVAALAEVASVVDPRGWAAIGLSAMLPTLVCLDSSGDPIGPAVTWEDGRAEAEGAAFVSRIGSDRLYRLTGQRVDGRYLLPMHAHRAARERRPAGPARIRTIVGAKDYLFLRLTGQLLTDPSTAAGYGAYDLARGDWDRDLLRAGSAPAVPEIASASEFRPMTAAAAAGIGCSPGIPVVLGAADSVLGALGLGAVHHGDVAYIAGTSTVVLGHSAVPDQDPQGRFLVTPAAVEGYGREMDLLATGAAFDWLAGLLGLAGGAQVSELAATVPARAWPIVLPYLSPGEQGALWDPRLRGSIHGVSLQTGRAELARALQSAIVLESMRCVRVLDEGFGPQDGASAETAARGPLSVSGSSAASPSFRQDLADATGRVVTYQEGEADHSAIGAAILAARAVGGSDPVPAAEREQLLPDPERAGFWSALALEHDRVRTSLYPRG